MGKRVIPKKKRIVLFEHEKRALQGRYTYSDVLRFFGINRVTLQDWLFRGYIEPDIKADGKGTRNYYSKENLYQISLFCFLTDHGFYREEAARLVKEFRKERSNRTVGYENPRVLWCVMENNEWSADFFPITAEENALRMADAGSDIDLTLSVNIGKIMEETDSLIQE